MNERDLSNTEELRVFTRLWLENQNAVAGFVYLNVRDFHHAEDIIQETASSAVDSFSRYDSARPFAAWVISIAKQKIALHYRRVGRSNLVVSSEIVDVLGEACAVVAKEADERAHALQLCMKQLGERYSEVVSLRYGEGLKSSEVADRMGMNANAVNALIFRARKALGKCIEKHVDTRDA